MNRKYKNKLSEKELAEKYKILSRQIKDALFHLHKIGENKTLDIISSKTQDIYMNTCMKLYEFQSQCENEYLQDIPDGNTELFYKEKE